MLYSHWPKSCHTAMASSGDPRKAQDINQHIIGVLLVRLEHE